MRFSLKKAILAITLLAALCLPLMSIMQQARREAGAIESLERVGAKVWLQADEGWQSIPPQIEMISIVEFDSEVEKLDALTHLEIPHLAFVNAEVTPELVAILVKIPALQKLNLSDTNVDDSGLESLAQVESLAYLKVMGSKVTPAGVHAFHQARPDCILSVTPDSTFMQWLSRLFDS
ncbi:MAG: hypothetical protein AAF483_00640 [Planctomycetota bacterium]